MPEHSFVSSLRRALTADAHAQAQLAVKVATLRAKGASRSTIAETTGASPLELRGAYERLQRVAPQLDRSSDL